MRIPQLGFGTYICEGQDALQRKEQHPGEGRGKDQQEGNQQKPHHIHRLSRHISRAIHQKIYS